MLVTFFTTQLAVNGFALAAAASTTSAGAHLFSPETSLTVERLEIPGGAAPSLTVSSLLSEIRLSGTQAMAAQLTGKSRLCPEVKVDAPQSVTFRCSTPRFSANLKGNVLTIVELRGLPWRADDDRAPRFSYAPAKLELAPTCPGRSAVERAECSFDQGDLTAALAGFGQPAEGAPSREFALLRLGDIAELQDDPEQALGFYQQAATGTNAEALMAHLRICELVDECPPFVLAPRNYPPSVQPEAELRVARYLAFHGAWPEALALVEKGIARGDDDRAGLEAQRVERRLLIAALHRLSDDAVLAPALEIYLGLPGRMHGAYAAELTAAAAEAAATLGVPRFGAHLMAAIYPMVPVAHRTAHVLRTVQLYQIDDDRAHAEALLDFARSRFPASELKTPAWQQAFRNLRGETHAAPATPRLSKALTALAASSPDLAAAMRPAPRSAMGAAKPVASATVKPTAVSKEGRP